MASRRGFTLVELLIVIGIIGLLVAMFIVGGGEIRRWTQRASCQSHMKGLMHAYMAYASTLNNGRLMPSWHQTEWNEDSKSYNSSAPDAMTRIVYFEHNAYEGRQERSFGYGFGPLLWHRLITDSDAFICPVIRSQPYDWFHPGPEADFNPYFHARRHNPNPITLLDEYMETGGGSRRYSESSYSLRMGLYPKTSGEAIAEGMNAFLADNFHFYLPDDPDHCVIQQRHETGVCVAYLDGHTEYRTDSILQTRNRGKHGEYKLGTSNPNDSYMGHIWVSFDQ